LFGADLLACRGLSFGWIIDTINVIIAACPLRKNLSAGKPAAIDNYFYYLTISPVWDMIIGLVCLYIMLFSAKIYHKRSKGYGT
jgi:hypothetical protein